MPIAYKILGQVSPAASTDTTLYTAATDVVVSSLVICNENATPVTYRIAVRKAGVALAAQMYVAYEVTLPGYTSDTMTLGVTMAATDVLTVRASATLVAFNAFGSEIS